MRKFILALLTLLSVSLGVHAYSFQKDGIYYWIADERGSLVWVDGGNSDDPKYSGKVTIPSSVTNDGVTYHVVAIQSNAFEKCDLLEEVVLPSSVQVIKMRAFKNCSNLKKINLGDNIVELGGECFQGCSSLTNVVLSSNLKVSGGYNFRDCTSLKTIEIHDGAQVVGDGEFSGCTSLLTVDIPNSILTVGPSAFKECKSLTTVKIGDGVQTISYHIFTECTRLATLILGAGINDIGWRTAVNATSLKSITCLNPNVPTLAEDAFATFAATVYVPSQSLSAYQSAETWKLFSSIKAYEEKVYLTIRQGEQGAVKQLANVGEVYHYTIQPENGWIIHSVTYNNEDVTKQLVDNTYTTPAVTKSSFLNVVFEQEGSGVAELDANPVHVSSDNEGHIVINNLAQGELIAVYSTKGDMVQQTTADGLQVRLNIGNHGVYIVKVGNRTFKLSM